ncbi:hypothetical protein FHS27_001309 [Rhodopirellula rubra]|uniref:Uncharacterized protein n=1 Tax=Aporhodopirellula rubra TaxID=980271 RepID=A0A7W5H4M9_9BACT|nr:hypothetical protein [Aporhodopirellula rubra]
MTDSKTYEIESEPGLAHQALDERIRKYLVSCDQRGHRYQPGHDCYPTIKRLAAYLECDPTTLSKLKMGRRKQINFDSMTILAILSGICPGISSREVGTEKRARLADADRWVAEDSNRRGTLIRTLMNGIDHRRVN